MFQPWASSRSACRLCDSLKYAARHPCAAGRKRIPYRLAVRIRKSCDHHRIVPGRRGPGRTQSHDFRILTPRWLRGASHQHSRITWGQLIPSPRHLKHDAQIGQMGVISHSVLFRIRTPSVSGLNAAWWLPAPSVRKVAKVAKVARRPDPATRAHADAQPPLSRRRAYAHGWTLSTPSAQPKGHLGYQEDTQPQVLHTQRRGSRLRGRHRLGRSNQRQRRHGCQRNRASRRGRATPRCRPGRLHQAAHHRLQLRRARTHLDDRRRQRQDRLPCRLHRRA